MNPLETFQLRSALRRLACLACLALLLAHGCSKPAPPEPGAAVPSPPPTATPAAGSAAALRTVCSRCHVAPEPATLPRDRWARVLENMYGRLAELPGRAAAPAGASLDDARRHYEAHAPERLSYPALAAQPDPLRFVPAAGIPESRPTAAGVTHFVLSALPGQRAFAADTAGGAIYELSSRPRVIARLNAPGRFVRTDLDRDGREDLVVAEIGSFLDVDTKLGAVRWLRQRERGSYESITLLQDAGRVADVAASDFDRDGDVDLAVAIFGVLRGSIVLLENRGVVGGRPRFEERVVDRRDGGVAVAWGDLDADGAPELIAALSQQHETVMAYQLLSDGGIAAHVLASAPHPAWGTSGMQLVDLDADADLDVLWVNGDVMPHAVVPAEQGVHWLENSGGFAFRRHFLSFLAGAHVCRAHDLDRDGDLDIVAAAALPWPGLVHREIDGPVHGPSLIWLEQTQRGQFVAHVVATDHARHTWIELADHDGDGDDDIYAAELDPRSFGKTAEGAGPAGAWISIWRNQLTAR